MWKRYDELTGDERKVVSVSFSGDALVMGAKNVSEVRRQYGYWCDGFGTTICRRKINQIVDWNQTTLY